MNIAEFHRQLEAKRDREKRERWQRYLDFQAVKTEHERATHRAIFEAHQVRASA